MGLVSQTRWHSGERDSRHPPHDRNEYQYELARTICQKVGSLSLRWRSEQVNPRICPSCSMGFVVGCGWCGFLWLDVVGSLAIGFVYPAPKKQPNSASANGPRQGPGGDEGEGLRLQVAQGLLVRPGCYRATTAIF